MVSIRLLKNDDALEISSAFQAQGWHKPAEQYEKYWAESQTKSRTVLIAEIGEASANKKSFAGYTTIVWQSDYPPFLEANIPEIVDFNVLKKYQRQGVGTALMDEAERLIAEQSPLAGIGVGLMHDYGNAQILYAKRGYLPDGRGIFAHGRWLQHGDQLTVDDHVALYLTKRLNP